jgi:hypothetical protein
MISRESKIVFKLSVGTIFSSSNGQMKFYKRIEQKKNKQGEGKKTQSSNLNSDFQVCHIVPFESSTSQRGEKKEISKKKESKGFNLSVAKIS